MTYVEDDQTDLVTVKNLTDLQAAIDTVNANLLAMQATMETMAASLACIKYVLETYYSTYYGITCP